MAHNVETMAYTNEVPWHGLGFKVDGKQTVPQMLKAAKLDWRVERRPMFIEAAHEQRSAKDNPIHHHEIEGFAALVRDRDNAVFDVVGSQYKPVQNSEAFEFFNEFVTAGKASMETAGSLRGGRIVWGLAALKQSFTLSGSDKVNGYLLCVCPHQQGKSLIFKFTSVRVVCNNTLTLALRAGNEHRRSHRSEFTADSIEQAKVALGIAREQMDQLHKTAIRLQKLKMTDEKFLSTIIPIFDGDADVAETIKKPTPRIARILDIYYKAPGAQPGNAWGALNAVTYFADHVASRSADKRMANAWLGRTANQKEQVLEALLAL